MLIQKHVEKIDIVIPNTYEEIIYVGLAATLTCICYFMLHAVDNILNNTDTITDAANTLADNINALGIGTGDMMGESTKNALDAAFVKAENSNVDITSVNKAAKPTKNLPLQVTNNFHSVRLIIVHGQVQLLYLVTVANDLTMTLRESAVVDVNTSGRVLQDIQDRFFDAYDNIINSQTQPIRTETVLFLNPHPVFFEQRRPFIPILDVFGEHPFHLSAYLFNFPGMVLELQNVASNILILDRFQSRVNRGITRLANLINSTTNLD